MTDVDIGALVNIHGITVAEDAVLLRGMVDLIVVEQGDNWEHPKTIWSRLVCLIHFLGRWEWSTFTYCDNLRRVAGLVQRGVPYRDADNYFDHRVDAEEDVFKHRLFAAAAHICVDRSAVLFYKPYAHSMLSTALNSRHPGALAAGVVGARHRARTVAFLRRFGYDDLATVVGSDLTVIMPRQDFAVVIYYGWHGIILNPANALVAAHFGTNEEADALDALAAQGSSTETDATEGSATAKEGNVE